MAISPKVRPDEDLLEYIDKNFDQFTPTQKNLANYLSNNLEEAAFLTADEISIKINSTPSTITRFAKDIGLNGFPDIKRNLKKKVINKVNSIRQLDLQFDGQFQKAKLLKKHDKSEALKLSMVEDLKNLEKLIMMKNEKDIKKFVDILTSAKKKYIISSRSSHSLGHFLSFQIKKILSDTFFLNNFDGSIYDVLRELDNKDVVIPISFPRYIKTTFDFANLAYKKGINVISITDSRLSPLYKISQVCLFCPHSSPAPFHSYVAPLALINAILCDLFYRNYDLAVQNLKMDESVIQKLKLYQQRKKLDFQSA